MRIINYYFVATYIFANDNYFLMICVYISLIFEYIAFNN